MRPQLAVTSPTLSSLLRLQYTSITPSTLRPIATIAGKTSPTSGITPFNKNSSPRLFSTTPRQHKLVKPQSETTDSKQNIHIPTPSAPVTMSTPINANSVLDLIKNRRTYYQLNKDLGSVSPERINEIVKEALRHVPSSFNSQSNRVVVLLGAEHDKFWDFVSEVLKIIVPEDQWAKTAERNAMFKAAAGSVLFFEDQVTVNGMQEKFALYADKFPTWATQSSGMLQFTVWTALEAEGLGANLQHYNPLVDQKVTAEWNLPVDWKLSAQLVFGGRAGELGPKDFKPFEEIFKTFGA